MKEEFSLKVTRYRDKDGQPTCAADFPTEEICRFYGTKVFGSQEVCMFHDDTLLTRRKKGEGTLIPLRYCPLWEE